jgi:multidrug efflux pump
MFITDISIRNRTTVAVLGLIIAALGVYSYTAMPRESFPDIPIPHILVTTPYEGVSPEDMESSVTMKIEKELNGVRGVKQITSRSAEGLSLIDVEFLPDVAPDVALQRVRDRVDAAKGELPQDAKEPVVKEISLAESPIMLVSVSGNVSPWQLKIIADRLQDALEAVPGVLKVDMTGALEREIRLEMDPDRIASYGLTIPEIMALVPAENVNISAGNLETEGTRFNVRIPAEFTTPEEVDHLLLTVRNGRPIYLTDVGRVRDTFKDRATYSRLNGTDNITLSIQKRTGANIVQVADYVKAVVAKAREQAPQAVTFDTTFDMSKYIRDMVADLENNMASGLVLVIVVLMAFLGWRSSIIVSLIIPITMLASFFILMVMGYTFNMIVLFSLILGVGMIVDSAIVIVENIYRHMELGKSRVQAATIGTREVAWPVIASTATNIASFIPLMFWPGLMGSVMKYLPITVTVVIGSSLVVALIFNPTFCSVAAAAVPAKKGKEHWFVRGYRRAQRAGLDHPLSALFLCVCLLISLSWLYVKVGKGTEFFPDEDPERAMIEVRTPQGTNIRETDRIAHLIENRVEPYRKWIKHVVTNVGTSGSGMDFSASSTGPHLANVTLVFYEFEKRERPSTDIIAQIRRDIADIPGAEIKIQKEENGPPTGAPVEVRVIGEDFPTLQRLSEQARGMIANVPNLVNLRSDLEATRPELAFSVNRREAMLAGVNTATVGNFLKTAIFGTKVGTYRQFNDEYDITVRLPLDQRKNLDNILRLQVPNAAGRAVPLSSLGRFEYKGGFGTINRISQKRVVTLTADTEGRLSSYVLKDVQERLAKMELPPTYELQYAGEKEQEDESSAFLVKAFILVLALVTLVLVSEFNSLMVTGIIMSTVILSLIGALLGLLVWGLPFGIIMSGIGVISLAGIVVNNGIVLLDYTRQLQQRGMDVVSATVEAGVTRLRPVLLSAVTNFVGLVPMALGVSFDFHTFEWSTKSSSSQWWNNMAVVMIFGLSFGTILTLVVVPSLYVMVSRIAMRLGFDIVPRPETEKAEAAAA